MFIKIVQGSFIFLSSLIIAFVASVALNMLFDGAEWLITNYPILLKNLIDATIFIVIFSFVAKQLKKNLIG